MSEYLKMLHEIEAKKEHLERRIAQGTSSSDRNICLAARNKLAVKGVYLKLTNTDKILNDMRL
ncbi:hypothetical protein D3C80_728380 [compost metagenome]